MQKIKTFIILLPILLAIGISVYAIGDDTALTQEITAGSLAITADATAVFGSKSFSYSAQDSTGNALGVINAEDLRGSKVGWSIDVTAADWSDGTHSMDYDGNGTTTGQLGLDIPAKTGVTPVAGDTSLTQWTMGTDDVFDSGTATINLVTVTTPGGSGNYNIPSTAASQHIPGQQLTGSYATTLTYTIS